jgi:hypothetical protein
VSKRKWSSTLVSMPRTQSSLLANREVKISIDNSVLRNSVRLSLSAVRMQPETKVLTTVVECFAREVVSPLLQAYLKSPEFEGNEGNVFYLQGTDVPRDVYRLVQVAIQDDLMEEME